jgi:hypothetical protein
MGEKIRFNSLNTWQSFATTKIMALLSKTTEEKAKLDLELLLQHIQLANLYSMPVVLLRIYAVAEKYGMNELLEIIPNDEEILEIAK